MPPEATGPLGAADDHLIHQTMAPISISWTDDPRAFDRYWFNVSDRAGRFMIVQGAGVYPNLGTADAFAIVVVDGHHATVRTHRKLGQDRLNLRIGPVDAEVIEGLRMWRLRLHGNELGISYDIVWTDAKISAYHEVGPILHEGRLVNHLAGFENFGRADGWLDIQGERIEITPETIRGARDRHWGVRNGVGGPEYMVEAGSSSSLPWFFPGQWVDLGDVAIFGARVLAPRGAYEPSPVGIAGIERRLRFEPNTRQFLEGTIVNRLVDGRELTLHYRRIGQQVAYLRCGMYGGAQGGTPNGNLWHGMPFPDGDIQHEIYDLSDPAVRRLLMGLDEHLCLVSWNGNETVGILEAYEPETYERCAGDADGFLTG